METGVKTLVPPDNPKRKNPWGVAPTLTSTPCSLAAVMDEQLARELQDEEEDIYKWVQEFMLICIICVNVYLFQCHVCQSVASPCVVFY